MSVLVSTARPEKPASGFEEASSMNPELWAYASAGLSELVMAAVSPSVTVPPEAVTDWTVGEDAAPVTVKSPGAAESSVTSSDISRVIPVGDVALADSTTGGMPSPTSTVRFPSGFAGFAVSAMPPLAGTAYVRMRSGAVSCRLPERVSVRASELPPGSVFDVTVRFPASAPESDHPAPLTAPASTFSENVTTIVLAAVALADCTVGGTVSSTVIALSADASMPLLLASETAPASMSSWGVVRPASVVCCAAVSVTVRVAPGHGLGGPRQCGASRGLAGLPDVQLGEVGGAADGLAEGDDQGAAARRVRGGHEGRLGGVVHGYRPVR